MPATTPLSAGPFSDWLREMQLAMEIGCGTDVPCGDCVACCSSSYFIHLGPDDLPAKRRIPKELQFRAPGLPKGHAVMGYDEHGRCPMLVDGKCSVYEDRPRTCRVYDCRVFAAAGMTDAGEGKEAITRQAVRWTFEFPSSTDIRLQAAVRHAADFLRGHAHLFPDGFVPANPTQLAVLAVKVHDAFLEHIDDAGRAKLPAAKKMAQAIADSLE